ncbi:hypothetical protein ACQBAT_14575 [Ornithinimicrobium sp. Y1847]|uniref:hypothetical protein n=1 Tax=unclassified Ornithinimicrobium TaxID=2615080 RepID=UPI003B66B9F4
MSGESVITYRAVPAHDELHLDGESLVLVDGQVQRVSPLGTLIRERAVEPATVEELAAALVEEFGAPPDGDAVEVTRASVEALVDAGLLERDSL